MLPPQIRSSVCQNVNGLDIHYLETGFENRTRPLIILLHGFPELCFSWRKIMLPLSDSGYHVVAPDQRGFGATARADRSYSADLSTYFHTNLVTDILGLVSSLGYTKVKSVIGHDSGAGVAGWSALMRPDIYESVVMMSAPFTGPPSITLDTADTPTAAEGKEINIDAELALLERPRKHYQHYYQTPAANSDIMDSKDGLSSFLRAYYHHKSADWKENTPFPLSSWTATELAQMPTYYIMDLDDTMPEAVAKYMPTCQEIQSCEWLTDPELQVYVSEYGRTGFQGGLNWYRSAASIINRQQLELFTGMKINVPAMFISGRQDWGTYQRPGAVERMKNDVCTNMDEIQLVDNAGHWVQQEQPQSVLKSLTVFLSRLG